MKRSERPQATRVYRNHHLDSTRWEVYQPRPTDIVITTSYKSGTTLTQQIVRNLLLGHREEIPELALLSPWPDARFHPITREQLRDWMDGIRGRRFLKSHLPLDGLPYYPEVKYLIVGRDPRDVFMSFANHYGNYTEFAFESLNGGDRVGDPLPPFPDSLGELWQAWITRGWFPWESEGWPFWGNMHHTQTYWEWRHLPNLCFLHYADLRRDHAGAVRKIAEFIEHPVDDAGVARVVEATSFETAKKEARAFDVEHADEPRQMRGGEESFIYKGTNGRWREVLGEAELEQYEAAKARVLSPDCAAWLESGGPVRRD